MTLTDRLAPWVFPLVTALVVLSVAAALAPLTWHLMGERTEELNIPPPELPRPESGAVDLASITAFAPFGSSAPRLADTSAGTATVSALILKGVMMARPASASTAFIAAPGEDTDIYRQGDTLPGGAVLTEVQGDRVFLQAARGLEVLTFPDADVVQGRANVRALIPQKFGGDAPGGNAPGGGASAALRSGSSGSTRSAGTGTDGSSGLAAVRTQIRKNPRELLDQLSAQPTPDGYRIGENAPDEVLRAGLEPGDLVTAVNGEAVGDVENDRNLFEKVAAGDRARVEVLRDGRTVTLSFPLR